MKLELNEYRCSISLWKEDGTFAETTVGYNILIPENLTTKEILKLFKECIKRVDKNE